MILERIIDIKPTETDRQSTHWQS